MRVLVGYSGGKDSSCAVIKHLECGNEVSCMSYIPFFDDNIPLLLPQQYEYLLRTYDYLRSLGVQVYELRGVSYYDWCMRRLVKGENKGLVQGFPLFIRNQCGFARDSKIKACDTFFNSHVSSFDKVDIGYTIDENRGALSSSKMSILSELGLTQRDTFEFMIHYDNGIFRAPSYVTGKRDGCVLCPHGKACVRVQWFNEFPVAKEKVKYMQEVIFKERGFYPLRHKKFFIENENFIGGYGSNISIFGDVYN